MRHLAASHPNSAIQSATRQWPVWVKIGKARNEHMFSALVPAHVCRGNIATNAIAIAVALPEFPISAYRPLPIRYLGKHPDRRCFDKPLKLLAHPTGFEPVASAFGGLWFKSSILILLTFLAHKRLGFAQKCRGLRGHSADASPKRLERPFLVARAMVPINLFDRPHRRGEEVGDVPDRYAILQHP